MSWVEVVLNVSRELTVPQSLTLATILRRHTTLVAARGDIERRFSSRPAVTALLALEVTPQEVANLVEISAKTREDEKDAQSVSFVWTGPMSGYVSTQATDAVVFDMISQARHSIIIVTYAAQRVEQLVLSLRLAAQRGVDVTIIGETSTKTKEFSNAAFTHLSGIHSKVVFYQWSEREAYSSLHAKILLVDGQQLFVTSANMTNAAMSRNIEAGILIKGGNLPKKVEKHILSLIAEGYLVPKFT